MGAMMDYTGKGVVLRFGELFLKGKNRYLFEQALDRNVRRALHGRDDLKVIREHGRIFVVGADDSDLMNRLRYVFGVASLSKVLFCEKRLDELKKAALALAKGRPSNAKTFRISARRSDKTFPHNSTELNRLIGHVVGEETGLAVNLTDFDYEVGVEVGPKWAFVWALKIRGSGGLPVGTAGKSLLLLSGGIDSPVAGHMLQKRGLEISACYFHSFPYTGDGAKDKVERLMKVLAKRQAPSKLYVVPFTKIQEALRDGVDAKYLVILYRRAMIRIAEAIAAEKKLPVLITGESLGQVASQTLSNLAAIEDAATLPILRPLIGFDKAETIALARAIGTYDISIEPHDDSCSLFVPKHPETKAKLKYLRYEEKKVELAGLMKEAEAEKEIIDI